jgi:gliding motility-associated-like protein
VISIFLNNGTGNFTFSQSFAVTVNPIEFVLSDFNHDNLLDVATTSLTSTNIGVLLGVSSTIAITSFSPTSGPIGTTVTITGINFDPTPANNIVNFNGTTAVVTASTATSISTSVPAGATTGPVTVTVGGNTATSATDFTVTASCIPLSERAALIAFYNATNGDSWASNENWLGPDESTWLGVSVTGCHVTGIAIQNNNLNGSLPVELGDLSELTNLSITLNSNLTGSIPSTLGNLSELTSLDLWNNHLTGSIPASLGNLSSLVTLQLMNNNLSGSIPSQLGTLPVIHDIRLDGNQLSGTLPASLFNLATLKNLELGSNQLSGPLSPSFANLTNLEGLGLNGNMFSGPIPTELGSLIKLIRLQLAVNQLTGTLPASIGNLVNLRDFSVFNNQLTGTVPASFANLVNLTGLGLSVNQFTGDVPAGIGLIPNLNGVSLRDNDFTSIPTFVSTSFTDLRVHGNKLNFGHLEPNISKGGFVYAPQDNLPGGIASACAGGALTINFSTPGTANSYQWYKGGVLIPGATSANFTKPNATVADAGNYTVRVTNSIVTGLILQSDNFVVTINAVVAPGITGDAACAGTTAILTASGSTNGNYRWYTTPTGGTPLSGEVNSSYTTPVLSATTTYYVSISTGSCESARTAVTATVNPLPAAPSSPVNGSSCGAGTVALSVSGGTNGQYRWYNTPTGGNAIPGEVNSAYTTPSISATTIYYAAINNGTCESTRTPVTATTNPIPTAPTLPVNGSSCGAGTVTISVSGGTNGQYRWYTAAIGGIALPGEVNGSYTAPSLSVTTTYYATLSISGCESATRTPVTATISSIPTAPTSPVNGSSCGAGTVTVSVSGGTTGQYRWYTALNGGTPIPGETNSSYTTPSISAPTNYYAAINNGTCESTRTLVTATIYPIPTAPTLPVNGSSCGAGTVTVSVSGGTTGQYRWYTALNGGTPIPGETNSSYTTPSISAPTSYYAAINNGTCESTRTSVTANVINTPAPTTTGSSICPGSTVTLTATGGANGQYKWYAVATGGTPITGAVNGSFTTAALSITTTFYVTITANGCESARTPVTATVNTSGCAPSIPAQTYNLPIEGKVEVDLKQLITTSGILDVNTIKIIKQPASGASASIVNGVLIIDYKGKPFVGREIIIIEACSTTGQCSQQTFEIDVAGDIVVFNGISPNGDGLNDFLTIQNIELLPETKNNTVMIYSRWGDEVFKVSDYNNADRVFKGETNNGSKLPAGTYFYKIVLPDADKTMTGFISIKH